MGGIRDGRTGHAAADRPVDLIVTGRVAMGGVDVSSEVPGERWRQARLDALNRKLETIRNILRSV